ncbi:glycosyltransferase [Pseudomonas hunanensis]|uniref:glycosyltransferase n=1 Tax=Pseudomonas hunanensis TaxID=1247546 RepID=UPI003D0545CF
MNILIVNYHYPPMVGAHAYRWAQLAEFWAKQGHSVTVLTSIVKGASRSENRDGVDIIRVGNIARGAGQGAQANTRAQSNLIGLSKKFLISAMRTSYRFLYWPDGLWYWLPAALLGLYRLRRNRYDLVVSYSPTFTAHLATLIYRKLFRGKCACWVADYGDPFSVSETMPPNNLKLYRKLNYAAERSVVANADCSVFTNNQTLSVYKESFGMFDAEVLPHLVDISAFYAGSPVVERSDTAGIINLVYVGGFHKGIREPAAMLSFFGQLVKRYPNCFALNIYGPSNGCDFSTCKPPIFYHGAVSRATAIDLIKEADCLVNIDNSNCVMVPSKLVEYIATGRPIVNFNGDRGTIDIMTKYGKTEMVVEIGPVVSDDDIHRVASFIVNKGGKVASREEVSRVLVDHDISRVGESYIRLGC